MYAILTRFSSTLKGVTGSLEIFHQSGEILFSCPTLELPWNDNKQNVSCIPVGVYKVVPHFSKKFGKCFWVQGVLHRFGILIHSGNTIMHTEGCILVGRELLLISPSKDYFLQNPKLTMDNLLSLIKTEFILKIDNSNETPF